MTLYEAIDKADSLYPNMFTTTQKIEWLSEIDSQAYEEVLLNAKKNWKPAITIETIDGVEVEKEDPQRLVPAFEFEGYNETTPEETPLLMDDLYASAYVDFLISRMEYYNHEVAASNNAITVFNGKYSSWAAWYRRKYEPIRRKVMKI